MLARKKPITIEVWKFGERVDGRIKLGTGSMPTWMHDAIRAGIVKVLELDNDDPRYFVDDPRAGASTCRIGDYIARGTAGEIYVIPGEIFPTIYDVVDADDPLSGAYQQAVDGGIPPLVGLDFGQALWHLRAGKRVCRTSWNYRGQFVYLVPAASYPARTDVAKAQFGDMVPYRAYLALKTAQGDVATWAPSCSDALAEDWEVVP